MGIFQWTTSTVSHCKSEHVDNAAHALTLPPDGAAAVHGDVPVAGGGHGQAGPRLLQDDAGHHVLVCLLQLGEGSRTALHDTVDPHTRPAAGEVGSS